MNTREDLLVIETVAKARVVALKLANVADPPDVVAAPRLGLRRHRYAVATDALAGVDGLQNRDAALATTAHVVDRARPRILGERLESRHQIFGVNVVAHLLA